LAGASVIQTRHFEYNIEDHSYMFCRWYST